MSLAIRARPTNSVQRNVQVGNEIKCKGCRIVKNKSAFSSKALDDLVAHAASNVRFDAKITQVISCIGCTQRQVTELQCSQCDKWKGLDAFSKAQRRERDKAKCWACMKEQLATGPAGQSSSDDDDDDDDDSDDYDDDSEESGGFYSGDEDLNSSYAPMPSLRSSAMSARLPRAGHSIWSSNSAVGSDVASTRSIQSGVPVGRAAASTITSLRSATGQSQAGRDSSASTGRSFTKPPTGQKKVVVQPAVDSDDDTDQCISDDDDDD